MLAKVNGETYEEQLCFSSKELQVALSQFIKKSIVDNPSAAKFMIAPNDNVMACTCESCKKAGNTASNASPAVFKLINLLAVQFPKQEFYGLSYHSTKAVPDIELKPNVGVMYSTIHLPKGVSLKESNFASLVENEISAWNAKLDKIYIWDYVIHFDNYLNTFPTILSSKNNLMWLKELGVDGMFLQGNEEAYAAFSDLKAFVYGELLVNPNYDLSYLVSAYFNNFYPKSAHLLTKYYLQCEMLASLNQAKLDIYGGWKQDIKKYLHPKELRAVCDSLLKIYPSCSTQEKKYLDPLLTALTYQNLEVMRLNGILPYGLYKFNSETGYWQITKTLDEDFRNWQNFSKLSAFKVLNEAKITVPQYNEHWNLILKNPVWNSLIAGSKPDFLSTPDEVYRDASILTDGAIGFVDYYNNWLIATENPLKIKINLNKEYSGPATLEIGFLQQKRHRIFLPKSIRLKLKEETIELPLDATNSFELDKNHNFSWDVELKYEGSIEIFVIKQDKYLKFANALDEIKLIPKK